MRKFLAVVGCLSVAFVGCGSSTGTDAGGNNFQTFSAWCIGGANAYCTKLYQCLPTLPGSVAACEATPDNNCESKTCPSGTTFNSANASACITAYQNALCANIEAGDVPTGCGIAPTNTNICTD